MSSTCWWKRARRQTTSWPAPPSFLHQLADERLGVLGIDAERPPRQATTFHEHGLLLIQRGQVIALPEQPDRNLVAPFESALHGQREIGRVVRSVFELG